MNTAAIVAIVVVGFILSTGFLAFFAWLIIDKFFLRKRYYRLLILTKSGGMSSAWARKTEEKTPDNKYNIARTGKNTYMFTPQQVRRVFGYDGLVVYENTFMALDIDFKKLEFDSKTTLHPEILNEFLNTKLISELLAKKSDLALYLLIATAALIALDIAIDIYFGSQSLEKIGAIQDTINMTIQVRRA